MLKEKEETQYLIKKRIQIALRRFILGAPGTLHIDAYIGCTREELLNFLSYRWKPGWDCHNYGKKWSIAMLAPISLFDLSKQADLEKCFHYMNMMPVERGDALELSISKSILNCRYSKIGIPTYVELILCSLIEMVESEIRIKNIKYLNIESQL